MTIFVAITYVPFILIISLVIKYTILYNIIDDNIFIDYIVLEYFSKMFQIYKGNFGCKIGKYNIAKYCNFELVIGSLYRCATVVRKL